MNHSQDLLSDYVWSQNSEQFLIRNNETTFIKWCSFLSLIWILFWLMWKSTFYKFWYQSLFKGSTQYWCSFFSNQSNIRGSSLFFAVVEISTVEPVLIITEKIFQVTFGLLLVIDRYNMLYLKYWIHYVIVIT